MRATIITVFLITFAMFIGGLVYRVDQLMFGDKLSWSEAQARSQMSPLVHSLESHLGGLAETLALTYNQIQDGKKDYSKSSVLSRFQMVVLLKSSGGKEWAFDKSLFLEKTSAKNWAPSYLSLLLKNVDAREIKPGHFAVFSLLDPERRPFLFVVHQMVQSVENNEAKRTLWFGVLVGPEFFQSFMDRSKGQISSVFLVNPQGQALAHTVPEYVGNLLNEDPLVSEVMRAQVTSGSGLFRDLKGNNIQGFYEQVSQSNVFAVITTPVSEILKSRDEVRWQLSLLGLGLAFVGVAVFVLLYRPEKQIVQVPVAGAAAQPTSVLMGAGAPVGAPGGNAASQEEIQKEKMQAFMRVSSALAHELNGPLASILGHAQLLKSSLGSNPNLDTITEQTRRSRETLRKLLTFAGEAVPKVEKTNVGKVVEKALTSMAPLLFRKGIQLTKEFQTIPDFEMPAEMIQKGLESILQNAAEALDRSSRKNLKVGIAQKAEGWVEISIWDSGEGIESRNMDKIFDPFFSTRKGHAGLGLSMALGIFKEINGSVFVESGPPPKGTLIRIMLNAEMVGATGLAAQTALSAGGFSPNAAAPAVLAAPAAELKLPEQGSLSVPVQDLIVLDNSEVDEALEGRELEEGEEASAEHGEEHSEEQSEASDEKPELHLEDKIVSSAAAVQMPPPPSMEEIVIPVSTSSDNDEATIAASLDSPMLAPQTRPDQFTAKIDKPTIQVQKKVSKADQVSFQIRKPGAKA